MIDDIFSDFSPAARDRRGSPARLRRALLVTPLLALLPLLFSGCADFRLPTFSDEAICRELSEPGAVEVCDGIDNDCDGLTDENKAEEVCDGIDNNCDGHVDENATEEVCDGVDNDCNGTVDDSSDAEVCDGVDNNCNGQVDENESPEICDGIDNDCDGQIDENSAVEVCDGVDNNCDGHVDENENSEVCDGIDNDCDGLVDEDFIDHYQTEFPDWDGDTFGVVYSYCKTGSVILQGPFSEDNVRGDCDDGDETVHPAAVEEKDDDIDSDCGGSDGPDPFVKGDGCHGESNCFSTIAAAVAQVQADETPYSAGAAIWVLAANDSSAEIVLDSSVPLLISSIYLQPSLTNLDSVTFTVSGSGPATIDGFELSGAFFDQEIQSFRPTLCVSSAGDSCLSGTSQGTTPSAHLLLRNTVLEGLGDYSSTGIMLNSGDAELQWVRIHKHSTGVRMLGGNFDCFNCTLTENQDASSNAGGAIIAIGQYQGKSCNVQFTSSTVSDNWSYGSSAGGIYLEGCDAVIQNTRVERNALKAGCPRGGGIQAFQSSLLLQHSVVAQNRLLLDSNAGGYEDCPAAGLGAGIFSGQSTLQLARSIVADNWVEDEGHSRCDASEIYFEDGEYKTTVRAQFNVFYDPDCPTEESLCNDSAAPGACDELLGEENGNEIGDPMFRSLDAVSGSDVHLMKGSPAINVSNRPIYWAGEDTQSVKDLDGTASDSGIYGGPEGGLRDADWDGLFDYFWPGTCEDVPDQIDVSRWDCDDRDPEVN